MSLVPPGPPAQSASAAKGMAQSSTRRPSHITRHSRNWLLFQLLVWFVLLFGFKLCLHTFLSSNAPFKHAVNQSDDVNVDKTVTPACSRALVKSPLQELSWIETGFERLSEEEIAIYLNIENRATLDVQFFAIPETVYPQHDSNLLYNYVEKQLKSARDVVTAQQAEFVLKLIESGVAQGSMLKKEVGDKGSLRNAVMIALMKEEAGNLHFAMAAVSVEPRLGWRLISKKQRNEWNEVLSRVVDTRLKQEIMDMFRSVNNINNKESEVKVGEDRIDDHVVQSLRELFSRRS